MAKQEKNPYVSRFEYQEFLNLPGNHEGAFIRLYVEDSSERIFDSKWDNPRIVFEMADCSERISLDFDTATTMDRINSQYKIDKLIEGLVGFRKALKQELALAKKREKERDSK